MNVDLVVQAMRTENNALTQAMEWALDHWDEASDRLLSKLRSLCAKLQEDDQESGNLLYYCVLLFAQQQDARAYAPLCACLARDAQAVDWMGDGIWGSLPEILIGLYDGDLAPLTAVIDSAEADESVRAAALEAFGYLVRRREALSDDEAKAFLQRFYAAGHPSEESPVWNAWALTVARLGFSDLAADVARLFSRNWIDESWTDLQEFHSVLGRARTDPEEVFAQEGLKPFDSALEMAGPMTLQGDAPGLFDATRPAWPLPPTINPTRDVGRNDPCPCGSGKKFKKCCLAA